MKYLHTPRKTVLPPELRQALVAAGHVRYQGAVPAPVRERRRTSRRQGFQRWRPLVLGGGVSGIAVVVAAVVLVFSAGSSPSVAFAAWRALPTPPAKGQVQAAKAACHQQGTPTLTDTRGPFSMLIYAHGTKTTICISGLPSTLNPSGTMIAGGYAATARSIRNGRSAILVPGIGDVLPTRSGDDIRIFSGQVRPDVTSVTLTLNDGRSVRATTEHDWFAAWWPSSEGTGVTSARLSTTRGTITWPLALWDRFPSHGHGHTTTTK
jgi:hypothetical protein